jgi:hypothetical protein
VQLIATHYNARPGGRHLTRVQDYIGSQRPRAEVDGPEQIQLLVRPKPPRPKKFGYLLQYARMHIVHATARNEERRSNAK